jgi:hypothetical protein
MSLFRQICLGLLVMCSHYCVKAQESSLTDTLREWQLDMNPRTIKRNDSTWILSGMCKVMRTKLFIKEAAPPIGRSNQNSVSIHGNVQYDFLYRTLIDTPFYQSDFMQHSVRTNFSVLFRNVMPFNVTVLHRNSNSPHFRDITDISFNYRHQDYRRQLRDQILQEAIGKTNLAYQDTLLKVNEKIQSLQWEVQAMEKWLASPARVQEIIAERELGVRDRFAMSDSSSEIKHTPIISREELPSMETIRKAMAEKVKGSLSVENDSILQVVNRYAELDNKRLSDSIQSLQSSAFINDQKQKLKELKEKLASLEKIRNGIKKSVSDSLSKIKQEITKAKDVNSLKRIAEGNKALPNKGIRFEELISSIETIGIGRSWIDYSELTIKNISLNGFNIEANPGRLYLAFAAGKVNNRFRDFGVLSTKQQKQSIYVVRAGLGRKNGSNIIATWYDGKRNLLNQYSTSPVANNIRPERVIGLSVETRIAVDENHYVIAEVAKSSFQTTGQVNFSDQQLFDKVRNLRNRSNEAYSIKFNSYWPGAGTKIVGYYKKMGENFQSFNLQPINSVQEAYSIKLQQQVWKRRLTVDAAIRKNDYNNPLLTPSISSSTIFKSLQLTLKVPKYPYITLGYMPASQLTMLDNQRIVEYQYNTLNAIANYSYRWAQVALNTTAMYLRLYNNEPDTGFIYYNATSMAVTQTFYVGRFQLHSGLTFTRQKFQDITSIEQSASYQARSWLSLNGSVNLNKIENSSPVYGARAAFIMNFKTIGIIQAVYEKSYLPGTQRNLLPVETGRLTYTRYF